MRKRTYVAVGAGGRVMFFLDALVGKYRGEGELLALCDISQTMMDYHRKRLKQEFNYHDVRMFLAKDFDQMLDELKPDCVLISTRDSFHHEYIIRAVNRGCDVVCEKPITIDDEKCREILSAPGISRQDVKIIFNVRWSPLATMIKEMVADGKVGDVRQIQYEAMLGQHGARYFTRWHSAKANSGGLLVHKSTHHFDLVNWWLDSIPQDVFAFGDLAYYGFENAVKRGQEALTKYERYTGVAPRDDPFYVDLTSNDAGINLYMASEKETGYIYDRNVFRREGIDIEDTLSLVARYRNGAVLSYSLNAYSPWGGYRVNIIGDRGCLQYEQVTEKPNLEIDAPPGEQIQKLTYLPLFSKGKVIDIPKVEGDHDGGDPRLQEQIFSQNPPRDPYGRAAGYEQGIASAILGIAANHSIATGKAIRVDDLISLHPAATRLSELK